MHDGGFGKKKGKKEKTKNTRLLKDIMWIS